MPRLFVGPATPVAGADKEFRIWLNYRRWRNFEFSRLNLRLPADVSAAGFWLMASFVVRAVVRIDSAAINPRKAIAAATPTIAKIGTEPLRRMVSSVFRRSPQASDVNDHSSMTVLHSTGRTATGTPKGKLESRSVHSESYCGSTLLVGHPAITEAQGAMLGFGSGDEVRLRAFQWKRSGGLVTSSCLKAGCFSGLRFTTKGDCRAFHSGTRPKPRLCGP
jgi:hypothetical protein